MAGHHDLVLTGTMKVMLFSIDAFLVILFVMATRARFKIGERRFKRRNVAGIEEFESYGKALFTRAWENTLYRTARLAQVLTVFAFMGSIIMLFMSHGHA